MIKIMIIYKKYFNIRIQEILNPEIPGWLKNAIFDFKLQSLLADEARKCQRIAFRECGILKTFLRCTGFFNLGEKF